jgi:hypothetical protein
LFLAILIGYVHPAYSQQDNLAAATA